MNTLGVLGPKSTFTDQASDWYIHKSSKSVDKVYFNTIWEVFDALKKGNVKKGIVPIENSIHGTVRETFDELFKSDLKIELKFSIPIHHCLAVKKGIRLASIKKIVSHQQALNQSSGYLRKNFSKAQCIGFSSTASAIKSLIMDKKGEKAVICSEKAAKEHGLRVIKQNIEDRKGNKTWFAVLGKETSELGKSKKIITSIAFHFKKDSPGTLFTVFKDFNDAKINMTKIESRPAPKKWGDYIFFLDFEGSADKKKVADTLKKAEKKVALLKNFGSYPVISGTSFR